MAEPTGEGREVLLLARAIAEVTSGVRDAIPEHDDFQLATSLRSFIEDDDLIMIPRDFLEELRGDIESAWWNCNGGNSLHQTYIDQLVKIGDLLGEPVHSTPSGQPLKEA